MPKRKEIEFVLQEDPTPLHKMKKLAYAPGPAKNINYTFLFYAFESCLHVRIMKDARLFREESAARCDAILDVISSSHEGRMFAKFYNLTFSYFQDDTVKSFLLKEAFLTCVFNHLPEQEMNLPCSTDMYLPDKEFFWEKNLSSSPFLFAHSACCMLTDMEKRA